ncbi:MAG: hypothetical protein ACWGMY_10200, partial [Hyphomicrobiaceae bacterium]
MFDLHPAILNAFVGLLGVLLLVFAWRSVSSLPALARWSLRLVLAAIIIVPFALLILTPQYEMARAPSESTARPDDAASVEEKPATKRAYKRKEADQDATDTATAAEPKVVAPPAPPATAPDASAAAQPPVAAPDSIPDVSAPRAPGGTRGL